jgi:2-keto-3-deoxy-L-fuconate dehydrogenase
MRNFSETSERIICRADSAMKSEAEPTVLGRLAGKTCVVMACGQGIGQEIALAYLREGARVIGVDLNTREIELHAPEIVSIALDGTDAAAVSRLAKNYPETSVLVNAVGWVSEGTILESAWDTLDRSFRINVGAMYHAISAFLPGMISRRLGAIINIASVASSVSGLPGRFAYGTTKAAVIGLTKSVARDYVGLGIRCNAISPGTILTPSLRQRMVMTGDAARAEASYIARQPMGRLGDPEEIAAAAVLLASDEMRFMTGANMIIDGGLSL